MNALARVGGRAPVASLVEARGRGSKESGGAFAETRARDFVGAALAGARSIAGGLLVFASTSAMPVVATAQSDVSAPGDPVATVEQPARAFGHVVGDVLVRRVVVDERTDLAAVAETLPAGRVDAWFERLPARVVESSRGRHALEIRHQIVNAPTEPLTVRLPPLSLALGDAAVELPEWPIGIGPLTPTEVVGEGDLLALRPDRLPPPLDTNARRTRLSATLLALAASALAWGLWWAWRRRSERVRLPFARARHALSAIPAADRNESPAAWTALHRAFDDTASGTVHRGSIGRLIEAAPWLAVSRAEIERFYAASAARFFARPPRSEPFPVDALGHALYRAEKRQAR